MKQYAQRQRLRFKRSNPRSGNCCGSWSSHGNCKSAELDAAPNPAALGFFEAHRASLSACGVVAGRVSLVRSAAEATG